MIANNIKRKTSELETKTVQLIQKIEKLKKKKFPTE